MTFKLEDLLPAKVAAEKPTPKERERTGRALRTVRTQAKARLIAQEYVRNGMDFVNAYNTVCHTKYQHSGMTTYRLLGKGMDTFIDELNRLLVRADVSRERALSILWSMVNTSVLDFMDEHGDMLPVAEMKKLPRIMQILITEIEVRSKEVVAMGSDGKPMLDDMGRPFVLKHAYVKIKLPEKLAAFRQLAEIMRWVGPTVNINNINIGTTMAEADARAANMNRVYEGQLIEHKE